MRYHLAAGLALCLWTCAPARETSMSNPSLTIAAKCRDTEKCIFEGKDLFLDIAIGNADTRPIGFPLELLRQAGPVIRLVDTRTKAETYLPRSPADFSLEHKFTQIPPGKAVTMLWVIKPSELLQFSHDKKVDVSAEITLKAGVQVDGKVVEYQGSYAMRITGATQ
jgi:hypothetical protein